MYALRHIKRFLGDQHATLSVEAVMIFPLLLWAYFGMFIMFDGYRTLATNSRATYTIADILSRETDFVTPTYLAGLNDMQDILTQSAKRTVLRVSVIRYDDDTDSYELEWSHSTAGVAAIEDATLGELMPHVPIMANPGVAIVVETYLAFEPFMDISLKSFYFESIVVTRPRFANQLVWSDT